MNLPWKLAAALHRIVCRRDYWIYSIRETGPDIGVLCDCGKKFGIVWLGAVLHHHLQFKKG
jgi:hypothetical protein